MHAVPLRQIKGSSQFNVSVLYTLESLASLGEWTSLYVERVGLSVNWPLLYWRHRLAVWEQLSITRASSHLMGCPIEWECSAKSEVAMAL